MNSETAATLSDNPYVSLTRAEIGEIMELIPHRYPMLLIDRVEDLVPGESGRGIKNVSMSDPFFEGHFPGRPIMPGVLIVEAMAQTAAVIAMTELYQPGRRTLLYFLSITDARFKKMVVPGDQLHLHVVKEKERRGIWWLSAVAKVEDEIVASASFSAVIDNE